MVDLDETLRLFEGYIGSDKGKKHLERLRVAGEIREERYVRFDKWLLTNDFEKLMYRIILEHDDDYLAKCYHNGSMPYPNNKLGFLIDYVFERTMPIYVKELDNGFPSETHLFHDFYFHNVHGQGTITCIINKDDMRQLLQV